MTMTNRIRNAVAGAALAILISIALACAPLIAALPIITKLVTDAAIVIDVISTYVDGLDGVSDGAKASVDKALKRTRQALEAVKLAASGATSVGDGDLNAALSEFRSAYDALLLLCEPLGVRVSRGGLFASLPAGGLVVPDYDSLRRQAGLPQ